MWTKDNRARYERTGLRYPSDLTDEEWALIEPFLPPPRRVDRRSLVDGVLYVLTTGCQWRQLPKDFPPRTTTHDYFVELHAYGILTKIHHGNCSPRRPGDQAAVGSGSATGAGAVAARATRMASRGLRPCNRPVETMERMSA